MLISPKPVTATETVSLRFPSDTLRQLDAYCKYLGEGSDRSYVIVEAVRHVLAKDRSFQRSRPPSGRASAESALATAEHPASNAARDKSRG
jgi:metal-responsive CopG/Arc/MetJ family transcriptional regulator